VGHKSGRVMVSGGDDKKVNMWAIGKPTCILVSVLFQPRSVNHTVDSKLTQVLKYVFVLAVNKAALIDTLIHFYHIFCVALSFFLLVF